MSELEKNITKNILNYLKTLNNCFAYKNHAGYYDTAGIPDIICCYKGKFVAFEVKRQKVKPTKLQEAVIQRIWDAEGLAYVVRSVDEVKKIMEVNNDGQSK